MLLVFNAPQGLAVGLKNIGLVPATDCEVTLERWDHFSSSHGDFARNPFNQFSVLSVRKLDGLTETSSPHVFLRYDGRAYREVKLRSRTFSSGLVLPAIRHEGIWRAEFSLHIGEHFVGRDERYIEWSPGEPARVIPDPRSSVTGRSLDVPVVQIQFAHSHRDESLGSSISWAAEYCDMPPFDSIPDLDPARSNFVASTITEVNTNYFRELARYEFTRRLYRPLRLVIQNSGRMAAKNVQIELHIPHKSALEACEMPDPPKQAAGRIHESILKLARPMQREPGSVRISTNERHQRLTVECGDMQPGRHIWSEPFYLGTTTDIVLTGKIFADNLAPPVEIALAVTVNLARTALTIDELCSLPQWVPNRGERFYVFGEEEDPVQSLTWGVNDNEEALLLRQRRVFKSRDAAERAKRAAYAQYKRH